MKWRGAIRIAGGCPAALAVLAILLAGAPAAAADQYADLVRADKPAGYWRLQKADDGRVINEIELPDSMLSLDGAITGEVRLASSGPQAGEFPLFEPETPRPSSPPAAP